MQLAREAALALALAVLLAAAMLAPVRGFGWESIDEIDHLATTRVMSRTLATEGFGAMFADVLLEPDIGRIHPGSYLYMWAVYRLAGDERPLALVLHAIPLILAGWFACVWTRSRGAGRGPALAAGLLPLGLATQQGNWHLLIHSEPLLWLFGLVAIAAAGRAAEPERRGRLGWAALAVAAAALCLGTKETGVPLVGALGLHSFRELWIRRRESPRERAPALLIACGAAALGLAFLGLLVLNRGPNTYASAYAWSFAGFTRLAASNTLTALQELWLAAAFLPVWALVVCGWGLTGPGDPAPRREGALLLGWAALTVAVLGPWSLFAMKNYFPALGALAAAVALLGTAGPPPGVGPRVAVALAAGAVAYLELLPLAGVPPGELAWAGGPACTAALAAGLALAAAASARPLLRRGLALLLAAQLAWALAIGERAQIVSARAILRRSAPYAAALDELARVAPRGAHVPIYLPDGAHNAHAVRGTGHFGRFVEDYLIELHGRADLTLTFEDLARWPPKAGTCAVGGMWVVPRGSPPVHAPDGIEVRFPERVENLVEPLYFLVQCRDAARGALAGRDWSWPRLATEHDFGDRAWAVLPAGAARARGAGR